MNGSSQEFISALHVMSPFLFEVPSVLSSSSHLGSFLQVQATNVAVISYKMWECSANSSHEVILSLTIMEHTPELYMFFMQCPLGMQEM